MFQRVQSWLFPSPPEVTGGSYKMTDAERAAARFPYPLEVIGGSNLG